MTTAGQMGGRSLDAAKIEAAYIGFRTTFFNRIKAANPIASRIATIVSTNEQLDRQLWLANNPKMRRWVGDKHLYKLRAESHPIATEPQEASLVVPKNDILKDKLGMYTKRINELADAYPTRLDEMVIGMLVAGIQGTAYGACYDGQNLIDDDHTALSVGGASQSNKVGGALDADAYAEAWEKFIGIKDENGVPQNTASARMTLVVGPANRQVARTIVDQQIAAAGASNLEAGTSDLIVTGWLSDGAKFNVNGTEVEATGNEWFLIPADSAAVIVHVLREPEFLALESGDHAFMTGQYKYGVEAEMGPAYGLWQEIAGGPGE